MSRTRVRVNPRVEWCVGVFFITAAALHPRKMEEPRELSLCVVQG